MTDEAAELRAVPGPSALGGGRRRFFELLYLIAVTDFKKTYFGTVLGYAWSLARPLMLFGVLLAVFTRIFHLSNHVPHYPVFLLFDIVLFGFFQEATTMAVPSVVGHEGVVRKTQFPRLVIPLSIVFTSLFNLALNLIVAFIFIVAFGVSPAWTWLLTFVVVLLLFIFTTAISMLVSALYPRFRDIGIIWTVLSTALFYATPVLYPPSAVNSHTLRTVIALNPLAPIMELAQRWVIDPHLPAPGSASLGGPGYLAIAIAIYVVVCIAGVWVFAREAPRIAEEL